MFAHRARRWPRTLLVVSHVPHYEHEGALHAYGPYALEIDQWALLFDRLVIAAPRRAGPPPSDAVRFAAPNVALAPQRETGGDGIAAKLRQAAALPLLMATLARAMLRADAIHVRCPGSLGLLGAVLAPLFSRHLVAKYAGQWSGFPGEPWTWRLQRRILASPWWCGPVTVYGRESTDRPHVVSFFTSVLTDAQMAGARSVAANRREVATPRILFAGTLLPGKNVHVLLAALARLAAAGTRLPASIVGDGPERPRLERLARELGVADHVAFAGAVPHDAMAGHYGRHDVLVLASESEGWPKALTEAMAFGLACIGSDRGLVPELLGDGRGLTVAPGDPAALADALAQLAASPQRRRAMQVRAAAWAQQYTLERLRAALRSLLEGRWAAGAAGTVVAAEAQ